MVRLYILFFFTFFVSANLYSQPNTISINKSFQEYVNGSAVDAGSSIIAFTTKEDTEGSQYLLEKWVKGKVILKNKQILEENSYILNFDKIQQTLIMMLPNNRILSVNMNDIESFALSDSSFTWNLRKVENISPDFVIELYHDSAYSLYKSIETRFYKSDYKNKGIYEQGYKYDRYVDKTNYFIQHEQEIINLHNGSKSDLKKLKTSFPQIKSMKDDDSSTNLDSYLIKVVSYLNIKSS
jgi:hypothetical protein